MSRRLNIGEQLGDYRIVGFLGAGGMGAVYHGVHNKIGRAAAIKVLSDVAGNTTFKERFFNEARLQSSLHHPNIATLYDFQESGDLLYIVMEYVDGETLDPLISRKHFAVEDALRTFESICDAVSFIHTNNIVHRDIKPQNIKVASNGKVKLLDFGIAKGDLSKGLTRIGGIIGTPNYLAPEQLKGESATQLSDIWALGVLLYEMLTGVGPFQGTTLEQLHIQITTAKFEEPEKINPAVKPEVSKIVARCLAVDPKMRYQSVADILVDVRGALRRYEAKPEERKGIAFAANKFFNRAPQERTPSSPGEQPTVLQTDQTAAPKPALPVAVIVGAAALGLLVVGFGVWALSGSGSTNTNAANSQAGAPNAPPQTTKSPVTKPQQATSQAAEQPPSIAGRARVTIELIEGSAEVYRDGQMIGKTPVVIEGRQTEMVNLTLKRDGYEEENVTIEITTRKKVFTFSMKKKK